MSPESNQKTAPPTATSSVVGTRNVLDVLNAEQELLLSHELAHAFIRQASGGRAPGWLHEGLAQWAEGQLAGTAAPPPDSPCRAGRRAGDEMRSAP